MAIDASGILDIPAQAVEGQPGTTDTAVLVRFQDDREVVPVGVQVGRTAREYLGIYNTKGCVVVGVRQHGVTLDLEAEAKQAKRKAMALVYLCHGNGIYTDRPARTPDLEMAAKVLDDLPRLAEGVYEVVDQLIAAYEGAPDVPGEESPEMG